MKLPNLFAPQTSPVPFVAGETIFAAGQPGDTMYLVQTGEVELRLEGRTLETVGPEGWFGEMALIEGGVRSADAVARTDCTLVPVNERQFLFMVGETPFFALQLLRTLSRRLRLADAAALALVVLLAVGWVAAAPAAAAQTLKVDQSLGNSPYTVTADAPYYQVYVGTTSTGVLNQSAYTLTVSGAVSVGQSFGNPAVSGTYNLSGGTLTALSTDVGYVGTGTFNQTGGTHTLSNDLTLASSAGTGTYNLGGTGTPDTLSVAEAIVVGYDGDGIFNQTAGTATAGNSVILGNLDGTRGAYNLNGGTLNTPTVRTAKGTGTFNFNGGTLQASASNTGFLSGLSATNVRNNGATIDTNGFNVTISQALTHSAIGTLAGTGTVGNGGSGYTSAPTVTVNNGGGFGATAVATINAQGQVTGVTLTNAGTNYTGAPTFTFSGGGGTGATATDAYTPDNATDGGLTKMGAGTLTLTGASTYTGTTYVGAGTLAVPAGGSIGAGSGGSNLLFIDGPVGGAAATLLISGGSVSAANAVSYIGNTGTGVVTVTAGSLTAGNFQLGTNTTGQGTLNVSGTGSVSVASLAVGVASGGSGTVNLNGGTLTAGTVVGGSGTSTFEFNGGTLQASASDNPGAASNPTTFFSGVTNAYVGAGGAVINTNGFNVTVAQTLLHDTTLGTTDGGLTKAGTGILTLAAANTYTGTTAVSAGTLAISANGGLGKGNVTVAAGGTLTLATGVTAAHNASTGTTLTLAATSTINLNATTPGTVQDTVGAIVIAGVSQPLPGTYGSVTSGAAHVFPEFIGNGEVLLTPVPEPGTWALLGVGTGTLALAALRRRLRACRV